MDKLISAINNPLPGREKKSIHHAFIRDAIPDWMKQSTAKRVADLRCGNKGMPPWLLAASNIEQASLKLTTASAWDAQNAVDRVFAKLQDVYAFAQPLLNQALQDQYGVTVDVRRTWIRLYSPAHLSPWIINVTGGISSRTVSLLDAALHNFSINEIFLSGSQFITAPDERGHFEVLDLNTMTIEQFKMLCRTLDIGARYKVHLEEYLRPVDALARNVLQTRVIESQKYAFKAAAHVAALKKDISGQGYLHALHLFQGKRGLKLDGLPVRYYHVTMLDTRLTGIVLMMPDPDAQIASLRRVIAYVPHDPLHPLKEYPSIRAFFDELTRRLQGDAQAPLSLPTEYQVFFSRFVDHQQRGGFFARLNALLFPVEYHGPSSRPDLPSWRETPAQNPNLRYGVIGFGEQTGERYSGDVWGYLFQQQVNKVLNDGRTLAIATADADSAERWAWIESLEQILSDILNVALLIVTPFVPFLGEMMLSYMVYQLASEVVEGVIDLAEGEYAQAAEHLIAVTESIVEAGLFAVGGNFANEVFRPKLSSFLESTRPVTLADGSQRLWSQNLRVYQQRDLLLPAAAKPDVDGLHLHQGKSILRVDSRHFELRKDPDSGRHRVQHPGRPKAYQPLVEGNGSGAFVIEGEKPQHWDADTLMRRLGPSVDGLSADFADIQTVSQIDASALRRMYRAGERAIPLLSDTITRFRIDRDIKTFTEQLSSASPKQYLNADPAWQFQLLDGLWPGDPVEWVGANGESLGYLGWANKRPVRLTTGRLVDGDVLKTLITLLDDAQTRILLGDPPNAPVSSPDVSARRLRAELAGRAGQRQTLLFEQRYNRESAVVSAPARVIQDKLHDLPGPVAQELVALATPVELQALELGQVPERLLNFGRWAVQDVRISRAYEGLFLESVKSTDSDVLVLHSLENLPGWNANVSIDIQRYRYGGRRLDHIGPDGALIQRTIILDENGGYQALDEQGQTLHPVGDLYTAILQGLPDAERNALGINIGEGMKLKSALREHALKPYQLQSALKDVPVLPVHTFDPSVMRLRGGGLTDEGEFVSLQRVLEEFGELDAAAYDPIVPEYKRYNYYRGLKFLTENLPKECTKKLWYGLQKANALGAEANQQVVLSIEALPELQKIMPEQAFHNLTRRVFVEDGLVPLSQDECKLAISARNLRETGLEQDYQALKRAVRDDPAHKVESLIELKDYHEALFPKAKVEIEVGGEREVEIPPVWIEVTPEVMANLRLAQRAIFRAKELLPLSGNQLPSIWEKGGSVIAKLKGLRQLDLQSGDFTARLTSAETAMKAIDIKGGNCSENSKVTFSILASQPRQASIHIVKATAFDHQYVVIGDDLTNLAELVVADSWPEFPVAHTAQMGYFDFELPALQTLEAGDPVADYDFINHTPPGPAVLPEVSRENTIRQIKINKVYQTGYAQYTSLKEPAGNYYVAGEVPVSFEWLPATVIDQRLEAFADYSAEFKDQIA